MTNMQNVLGFYTDKKLSLVYYCMHEKHAEFYGLSCMTNMQDVLGFRAKKIQFVVSLYA